MQWSLCASCLSCCSSSGSRRPLWRKMPLPRKTPRPCGPPGFRLHDCATQRNLTDKGRAEARRLGDQFRSEDVAVGKLMSSQWCRCQETAALMDLGPVELSPTFNNAFMLRDRVGELTAGARAIVAAWTEPGTPVVVTHGANILPLTGVTPEEGGMVIVKPDPGSAAKLRTLGRIPPLPLGP